MTKLATAMLHDRVIADHVIYADGPISRMRGLLGKQSISDNEGCYLKPCSSIHCLGMKFPIDVVYLDAQNTVLHVERCEPGALGTKVKGTKRVLELAPGRAEFCGVKPGAVIAIKASPKA